MSRASALPSEASPSAAFRRRVATLMRRRASAPPLERLLAVRRQPEPTVLRRAVLALFVVVAAACSARAHEESPASAEPIPECDAYVALVRRDLESMGERVAVAGERRVAELAESLRAQGGDRAAARARCAAMTSNLRGTEVHP